LELIVYDKNFNRLGSGPIEIYDSLIWTRNCNKPGTFELHLSLNSENLCLLAKNNIICKSDNTEEAAYIEYRELGQDPSGEEKLIVKGYFLSKWLRRRITWGKQIQSGNAEIVMKNYVDLNCINPTIPERKLPDLILSPSRGLLPEISYSSLYKPLDGEIEQISTKTNLGWRILFKPQDKQYIFDVYEGKNLSSRQSINPPAVFSMEYENILEQRYIESLSDYCNVALVAGEGEDTNRKTVVAGNVLMAGYDRYELFVDARDINSKGEGNTVIPEEQVNQMLTDRGNLKLGETIEIKSNLINKRNFDLGDILKIKKKKWGIPLIQG